MTDKDTKCVLPVIHLHTWPNKDVYACCLGNIDHQVGSLKNNTLKEIWNDDPMRRIRRQMLAGERPPECVNCFKEEDTGNESFRNTSARDFAPHLKKWDNVKEDGTLDDMDLAYWDFRFSNICNFSCRSCGPQLSSGWYKDTKKIWGSLPPDLPEPGRVFELWEEIEPYFPIVEKIYFAGGEPLMMEEHYRIINRLIEMGRTSVHLVYNSNLSQFFYKSQNILDSWGKFKRVTMSASLDGYGPRGEFVRTGLDWEKWVNNRLEMKEKTPKVEFGINATVSIQNAMHIPDFHRELLRQGLIDEPFNFNINLVHFPFWLNVGILPERKKKEIEIVWREWEKELKETYEQPWKIQTLIQHINGFIDFMNSQKENPKMVERFILEMERIDAVRDQTWQEELPEIASIDPDWNLKRIRKQDPFIYE
jgi:sulfatase maturation enzyme AslB (radical SAM superfamily)